MPEVTGPAADTRGREREGNPRPIRVGAGVVLALAALLVALFAILRAGESSRGTVALWGGLAALLGLAAFLVLVRVGRVLDFVGIGGFVVAVVALISAIAPAPVTRLAGSALCEAVNSNGSQFVADVTDVEFAAVTESNHGRGVVIRSRPEFTSDYDILGRLLPASCLVGFDGFCIGAPVTDLSAPDGPLDQLWFSLPDDEGFVAGGVVQEFAPGAIGRRPSTDCRGRPEPRRITAAPMGKNLSGPVTLSFSAPHAITVGVAAYYADANGQSGWNQVGLDTTVADGFAVRWNTFSVPPQRDVRIVYAVCWSGYVSGRAIDSLSVNVVRAGAPVAGPAAKHQTDLKRGASIACSVPGGGGGGA